MNRRAFSLLETAIAMTVLALIAGAALSATSMLKGAKIRRIVSEKEGYELAMSGFCTRYSGLPGDYSEATTQWPSASPATVDGNGNGQINFLTGGVYEGYRAWQHLTLANMVNGIFTGTATSGAGMIGSEVPDSAVAGAAYLIDYGVFGFTSYNVLVFGSPLATASTPILTNGILTTKDAQAVDSKTDDGFPNRGKIHGRDGNGSAAQSCYDTTNNIYVLNNNGANCTLGFRIEGITSCTQ